MMKAVTTLRGWLFFVWAIVSTLVYAGCVFIIVPFSFKTARAIQDAWCRHLLAIAGVRVRIRGAEKIDKDRSYFLVANHSSALDIPVLLGLIPLQLFFMAKKELFRIPVFGWGL
jgi:1-acyl-sn-glycerol-3-phosphate acyltransferase